MICKLDNILMAILFVAVFVVWGDQCFGQNFPFMVPEAPEFDSPDSMEKPPSSSRPIDQNKPFRSNSGNLKPQFEVGSMMPSNVPEAPVSNNDYSASYRPGPVRTPAAETQQAPPAMAQPQKPVASIPPQGSATGMRPQTDCSEFPMLIARSKSDMEMQMTSRHYLTCLMQGGWSMEQARDQVIRTIETAYRPGR